jgi:DeoR family transcriptional regulator, suf operon transcriptional repressor
LPERVTETAKLMSDLAYQAEAVYTGKEAPGAPPVIEATNCVYHALATQFPEVCEFDVSLLSSLTDATVVHEQCIIRGGGSCRFRFVKRKAEGAAK